MWKKTEGMTKIWKKIVWGLTIVTIKTLVSLTGTMFLITTVLMIFKMLASEGDVIASMFPVYSLGQAWSFSWKFGAVATVCLYLMATFILFRHKPKRLGT